MSSKVQMLARWQEFTIKQVNNSEDDELKRLLSSEGENDHNMMKTEVVYQYGPIVFDLADVKFYNRSKEAGHTTIHLKGGDSFVVKVPFLEYLEIDIQYNGKTINDFIPIDYIDPEDEEMNNETDNDLEL